MATATKKKPTRKKRSKKKPAEKTTTPEAASAAPAEDPIVPDPPADQPPAAQDQAAKEADLDAQIAELQAKRAALRAQNNPATTREEFSDLQIDASLMGVAPAPKPPGQKQEYILLVVPSHPPVVINGRRFIGKCKVTPGERDLIARMVSYERQHRIELTTGQTSAPWLHSAIEEIGTKGIY